MIKKIVFDGHDGVGKTTRIEEMKKLFPGVEFSDRGIFSDTTMNKDIFDEKLPDRLKHIEKFYNTIKENKETLYIILDAKPEECQKRILARGGHIDCEFHNMHDLVMYRERFKILVDLVSDLPNVMYVKTDVI
jgi:thymidylate kinase